jgi:hypothetical protein
MNKKFFSVALKMLSRMATGGINNYINAKTGDVVDEPTHHQVRPF